MKDKIYTWDERGVETILTRVDLSMHSWLLAAVCKEEEMVKVWFAIIKSLITLVVRSWCVFALLGL